MFKSFIRLSATITDVTIIQGSLVTFVVYLCSSITEVIIWRQCVEHLEIQAKVEIENSEVWNTASADTPEIYQKLF